MQISQAYFDGIQRILLGDEDPQTAMDGAAEEIQALLDRVADPPGEPSGRRRGTFPPEADAADAAPEIRPGSSSSCRR